MDSKHLVESCQYNSHLLVDMDRSHLVVHIRNSFLVEYNFGKHLVVGMDRNWLDLVGSYSSRRKSQKLNNSSLRRNLCNMMLGRMDSKHLVESWKLNNH